MYKMYVTTAQIMSKQLFPYCLLIIPNNEIPVALCLITFVL